MSKVNKIKQITHNPFLNYFELEAQGRGEKTFPYYMASRSEDAAHLLMNDPAKGPDGVAIFAVYGPEKDRVVLIRQYRYPLGGYIYEFPAGLVEAGEDYREAAVRELKEETGLEFHPVRADRLFEKGYFTTIGMTDECCGMVYGYCDGTPNLKGLEDTEDLQVVLADRKEAARILSGERVAMNCAYMLLHFLENKEDPLHFLRVSGDAAWC